MTNQKDIERAFLDYYCDLLGKTSEIQAGAPWQQLYPELPTDLNDLDYKITEEEIKEAVFSLAMDSTWSRRFSYRVTEDVLEQDIIKIFEDMQNNSLDLGRLNYTFIALIPKASDNPTVKDFCPISLARTWCCQNNIKSLFPSG